MSKKWTRVYGPDLDPNNRRRYDANTKILESMVFLDACRNIGTNPTRRQASKYRRKKGIVFCAKE